MTSSSRILVAALVLFTATLGTTGRALAWEPFRSENGHVNSGNAALKKNDPKGALAAYDLAARQLPSAPGVHLDRGLALMAQGDLAKARSAFLMATEPPAPDDVRAAAYYNMGLAFYREGDAAAQKDQHEPAQASFREAVDALKRSLRASPGNRDAAWNLELATRRIQEEKKKQEEKQKQDQQKKDEEKKQDQQNQDQDQKQDPKPDESKNEPPKDDQQQKQDGPDKNGDKPQDSPQDKPEEKNGQDQDPQQQQQQPKDQGQPPTTEADPSQPPPLPESVRKTLDALQASEDNFERQRAKARARRENRRVLKDW